MGDKIRKTVAHNLNKDIKLTELDFDPYQSKSSGKVKAWLKIYSGWNRNAVKEEKIQSKIYSD